jgi:hypothetical protein
MLVVGYDYDPSHSHLSGIGWLLQTHFTNQHSRDWRQCQDGVESRIYINQRERNEERERALNVIITPPVRSKHTGIHSESQRKVGIWVIPTRRTPEVAPQTPWVSDWALVGARRWRTLDANLLQTTLVPCTGGGVGCRGWIYPPLDLRCFLANLVEPQVQLAIGTLHSAVCKTSKIGVRWWEHESHCEWDRVRQ